MSIATSSPQKTNGANGHISVCVLIAGKVCVSPYLPYGNGCGNIKGSGLFTPKSKRIWLPVCSFLITTPHGRVLVDTGWDRSMSPNGVYDAKAQASSLGSWLLYKINQGVVARGKTVPEQLTGLGLKQSDIDAVVVTHLDCDHANGLMGLHGVHRVLVNHDEMNGTQGGLVEKVRFHNKWWEGAPIQYYDWNGTEGPAHRSYDVYGDGSVVLVNTPGHTLGHVAVKITGADGRFVLLFGDAGYSSRSWQEMVTSGISTNRDQQRSSLAWVRTMSRDPKCVKSMACHDPANHPEVIRL